MSPLTKVNTYDTQTLRRLVFHTQIKFLCFHTSFDRKSIDLEIVIIRNKYFHVLTMIVSMIFN